MQDVEARALKSDSANLDYLRTNAVLLVMFFHLLIFFGWTQLGPLSIRPMGILGVFLFFVHTSLVLMLSLERQQAKLGNKRLFLSFMIRRVFRVYPLSIFAVTAILLDKLPLGHLEPHKLVWIAANWRGALSNLLLVQNITETGSVLGPLWSLPYEMQMYLFLPALFLLAKKLQSPAGLIALWLGTVTLALLHARFGHMPDLVRYIPCFLPGVIAYKACSRWRRILPFWGWPALLFGLYGLFMLEQGRDNGWLICLVTGLAVPLFVEMQNPVLHRVSHVVAKYSYGIYLFHYFSIWLAFVKWHSLPMPAQCLIFSVSLVALSAGLYHLLEEPMIKTGNRLLESFYPPPTVKLVPKLVEPAPAQVDITRDTAA